MSTALFIVLAVSGAYLLGSIPWGYILGLLAGKDIRLEGSKNIGATNLWRVCGWKYGLPGFVLDFMKGLGAVLLFGVTPVLGVVAAFAAVLGHNFPVWLRFKGGKGVATSAGAVAGLMPGPFLVAIAAFIIIVWASHYISLGSMCSSVVLVAACWVMGADTPYLVMACLLCVMIIVRHRANIARIRAGTENRFPPPKRPPEQ